MGRLLSPKLSHLLLSLLALACGDTRGGPASPPPVPVVVARAEQRPIERKVKALGTVESVHVVRLTPQVDGQLLSVHFGEGDRIQQGQLLFRIDPRPFKSLLRQREAALQRDLAELRIAEAEAKRRAALFEQGFVSAEEHEQAQSRVESLRALVAADRAAVDDARLQLSYCSIYAPITGRAGQVFVHPGNIVRKNDTVLATVQQMHPVRIAFAAREGDLAQILQQAERGALVSEVSPLQDGATVLRGRVDFVDNTVQRSTGTILLKATFDNLHELLWPGQFLPVELVLEEISSALVVPRVALQTGQQGLYVFVLQPDNTVRVREVSVAFELDGDVVVAAGLQPGEWVVTEGQIRLTDGARVEVKERRTASPPA